MSNKNRWDIYFQHHEYPCIITSRDTNDLLYCNEKFFKLLSLTPEDVEGKKFHEIIPMGDIQVKQALPDWDTMDVFESVIYNKDVNVNFVLRATLTEGKDAVFCEVIPSEADSESNIQFEAAMTRCMELYNQPQGNILFHFMELLTQFYDTERAYIYRINKEKNTINCISQWSVDPDFQVPHEVGTKMDANLLIEWIQTYSVAGIVMANQDNPSFEKDSTITQILKTFKLRNLILCTVENAEKEVVGVVGLSNRDDFSKFFDRRLIHTISRFVAQEVTKQVVTEQLFTLHYRDALTGLYNRAGYASRVEKILESRPSSMGVISVNINGLKFINENAGIEGGDEHIRLSAARIKEHFGFEIFRMSGDEFEGLHPNVDKDSFETTVMALHNAMKAEDNQDFSLGHAWGNGNIDLQKLMFEANTIMYINKQEYYSSTNRTFDSVTDTTLSNLLTYLERDEFMVYLQPQVRLKDGSLYGAEALIRRFDKINQKMVFPDQFIPLYEQKSVIRHVDMFVVKSVCRLLQEWCLKGITCPVSVNLSRVTLQEYGIVEAIESICDHYQVPHSLLVIEVTERVGLIENNVASTLIQEFKDKGFHISLDDFGCAYSNIITLAQIEVDEVKIDKSLVDYIMTNKKNRILVKNVLAMCNELDGTSTLAEGIEDVDQAQLLKEMGCHLGQGYYYSRPIPVAEFVEKYMS